jgi:uncharacterized protein (UPF0297 family)
MANVSQETMMFKAEPEEVIAEETNAAHVIGTVCQALTDKGYNPINQIVGYLLSGDPAYITSYNNARGLMRKLERDEILEEFVRAYIEKK